MLVEIPAELVDKLYDVLDTYRFSPNPDGGCEFNNDEVIEVLEALEPYTGHSR